MRLVLKYDWKSILKAVISFVLAYMAISFSVKNILYGPINLIFFIIGATFCFFLLISIFDIELDDDDTDYEWFN